MSNIYNLIGHPSRKYYHKLKKIIEPLTIFCGVDRFWRNAHELNGAYSLIGNYPPTAEAFFEQDLYKGHPYFRHPNFFRNGFVFPELYKTVEYENTQGKLQASGDCYHVFLCIRKQEKGFIEYGFATSKLRLGFETIYMNHLNAFKKFIDYFEAEGETIIKESSANKINIAEIIGNQYNTPPDIASDTIVPKNELHFLAAIETTPERKKSILSLTKRERLTVGHYLNGSTTKQTAQKLYTSPRTVEKHLENTKAKLGITTRSELFDVLLPYHELFKDGV